MRDEFKQAVEKYRGMTVKELTETYTDVADFLEEVFAEVEA